MSKRALSKLLERTVRCYRRHNSKHQIRSISLSSSCRHEKERELQQNLAWSYCHSTGKLPLVGGTIGETLLKTVEQTPDEECLVFKEGDVRRSFQQLMKEVDQLAAALHNLGFKKGDRIGIWGPSTVEWVATHFATARIGVILVNVNPAYQTRELEYALNKTKMKGIISAATFKTQNYYEMLSELAPELRECAPSELKSKRLPHLRTIVIMGSERLPGAFAYDDVMQIGATKDIADVHNISKSLDFDDPISIQFTSGTTGRPKGATLTHHNVLNNIRFIGERMRYGDYHHRILCQVPLYHCFGMVLGLLAMGTYGSTVVFPCTGYDPGMALKALSEERINVVYGTPTMYIDMMAHPDAGKYDFSSLDKGVIAGSPCPPEVIQKYESMFGSVKVMVAYGTTENSPVTFLTSLDDVPERRMTSMGVPIPYTEAKIVNEQGELVPVNTPGELWIRGYCVMLGYWDLEDKTREAITPEGWYKTGDVATLDENGYGRIVGRTSDMIIRGGENIFPAEIEDFLHTFEKIDNVQVFGVPDKRLGEEVAAWISVRAGETTTPEEIREFCKGKLTHYKIPKHIKFVDEFPMTITKKPQKFKMQEEYIKELGLEK